MIEFTAPGSPRALSQAIEQVATGQGGLTALVVPWESDRFTLSLAVTAARGDGWAIEHTNLGTIRLTDLGNDATRVVITAHPPAIDADAARTGADASRLMALFDRFARQVQATLGVPA